MTTRVPSRMITTTGVVAGSYTAANITVNESGQITSASNGTGNVLEYANQAALPVSGQTAKLYITLDNNKIYRWNGSTYVEIVSGASGSGSGGSAYSWFFN